MAHWTRTPARTRRGFILGLAPPPTRRDELAGLRHEVLGHQLGLKVVDHPRLGRVAVHHLQPIPTSHPDLRLVQFAPADEATRRAFSALRP